MDNEQLQRPTVTIVYESMFGSTRRIAESIAGGLRETADVTLTPVAHVDAAPLACDLLIVGAPTHAHSLSRPASREDAARWAADPEQTLELEDGYDAPGVREWLAGQPALTGVFAAFDTRVDIARILTGSAAAAIDKRLRKRGMTRLTPPESFVVDSHSKLVDGELERAHAWGGQLGVLLLEATDDVLI